MSFPVRRMWMAMAMALILVVASCGDDGGTVFDNKDIAVTTTGSSPPDGSTGSSSGSSAVAAVVAAAVAAAVAVAAVSGNSGSSTITSGSVECSASGMSAVPVEQNLEEEAYTTREVIVAAAVACDYQALAALADDEYFAYDLGVAGNPADYWQDQEEGQTGTPLSFLVETLNLPFARVEAEGYVSYVWPAAYAAATWADVPASEQAALTALYGADISQDWTDHGQFDHYRAAIDFQGTWIVFMTGS